MSTFLVSHKVTTGLLIKLRGLGGDERAKGNRVERSSPRSFQRIMNDFKEYLKAQVFIYIDDLIVTSKTPEQHLHDIEEVRRFLRENMEICMKLKASKCEFASK